MCLLRWAAMNHGNRLRCHVPNPTAQSLTALVCDYPRSSLLRSCAASDRGEGPALEDQPPGSAGPRAWRMEEDRSRRLQGMKTCCFTYQSQTLLLFPLSLYLHLASLFPFCSLTSILIRCWRHHLWEWIPRLHGDQTITFFSWTTFLRSVDDHIFKLF